MEPCWNKIDNYRIRLVWQDFEGNFVFQELQDFIDKGAPRTYGVKMNYIRTELDT